MLAYNVDIVGLRELQAQMRRAPQVVIEELERATIDADNFILKEVSERMPVGAHGLLRKRLFNEEEVSATGVLGMVATNERYAIPVELGTKPHFPPVESLIDWVKEKFNIRDEKAARGAAFLVARHISIHGTVGKFPFQLASIATEEWVRQRFNQAASRIAQRLVSG